MALNWERLRIFHIVAEIRSFTHAGVMLGLSQSAVSRQISALEKDIGVLLFYRQARGLVLTEQGELLFHTAHDVLMRLESIESRLIPTKNTPSGVFRVTIPACLGSSWLIKYIPEFLDLYPDVQLQLILSNEECNLSARQADCAIRLYRPQELNLLQCRLFTLRFHLYASKNYLEKFGTPTAISDLANHRIITFGVSSSSSFLSELDWLEKIGDFEGDQRIATLRINDIRSIKKAAQENCGIGMLPDYMVGKESGLIQLLPLVIVPSFDTYFVYSESMKNNAKLHAFRDFLFKKAKRLSH